MYCVIYAFLTRKKQFFRHFLHKEIDLILGGNGTVINAVIKPFVQKVIVSRVV